MQLQTFRHYHPVFYERLLVGMLVLIFLGGVSSAFAKGGSSEKRSLFTPPSSIYNQATAKKPVKGAPALNPDVVVGISLLPPYGGTGTDPVQLGQKMNNAWFGNAHWPALYKLWMRESGWNPTARNRRSGACGIPQALPCRKIPDMSVQGQLNWGMQYIQRRYGNPTNAWRHSQAHGWY